MESDCLLYEIFQDRHILSWKPFEIAKKDNYFDIAYFQDKKYFLMSSEEPEEDKVSIKVKNMPEWSVSKYDLREIDDCYVFIKSPYGEYCIPKSFNEGGLSDLLGKKSFLITQQEFMESYAQ